MRLIEFNEQTSVFAKDQPEYLPLPSHIAEGREGEITCCWQLTFKERIKLFFTGKVWHKVMTFNQPLQPQRLQVDKPDFNEVGADNDQ